MSHCRWGAETSTKGISLAKRLSGFESIDRLLPSEPLDSWPSNFLFWLPHFLMPYFCHAKNKRGEQLNFEILKFKSEKPRVESKPWRL